MRKKCSTKDKKITSIEIKRYYDTLTPDQKKQYEKNIDNYGFTNNVVFPMIMANKYICKKVLSMLLRKKVTRVEYIEREKDYKLFLGKRGIRLDVYVENEKAVYNIEMQVTDYEDNPKRARFYQSIIDAQRVKEGVIFSKIKDMYIIFICTFDPFKLGLPVYTTKTVFKEDETYEYKDGVNKIFFNANMFNKVEDEDLKNFLHYCKTNKSIDDFTSLLQEEVEKLKDNEEWRKSIMTWQIHESIARNQALEKGRIIRSRGRIKTTVKKKD